jgi:hypothetical protein
LSSPTFSHINCANENSLANSYDGTTNQNKKNNQEFNQNKLGENLTNQLSCAN